MVAHLAHIAINGDDLPATRRFYEAVFGWTFEPWGPPAFFQIDTDGEEGIPAGRHDKPGRDRVGGALHGRRELLPGARAVGFECTFSVPDVDTISRVVVEQGGRIIMERTTITGVGHLVWFEDPSGNVAGAMQYDTEAE
jgi:uncharacterized protein